MNICPYCKYQADTHKRVFVGCGPYMGWECRPFSWWDKFMRWVKEKVRVK